MKKLTFLLSVLLISAFVLAACAGGDGNNNTPGVVETPGVGVATTVPGAGVTDVAATPMATEVVDVPTVAATATVAATVAATDAAAVTPAATDQAGAGGPVAADDDCNPNSVQGLLDMDVVDAAGNQIGDVNSLIVLRDTTALGPQAQNAQGTPAATDAAVTPAATDAAGGANAFVAGAAPQIAYVTIDLENEDDDLVVPLSALDLTVKNQGVMDSGVGANETPVAGTPAATTDAAAPGALGDVANELVVCAVTLNNVQADALTDLPRFDREVDFGVETWDEEYRAFWTGQGLQIPATGTNNLGAPALIDDEFNNVDARNPNGEDLGEVEDFIFTRESGEVNYAILAAGGFLGLGETKVPVPMARVQWLDDDPGDRDDAGYVVINMSDEDAWKNAPAWDDTLDTTVEGWDQEIQAYWESITD